LQLWIFPMPSRKRKADSSITPRRGPSRQSKRVAMKRQHRQVLQTKQIEKILIDRGYTAKVLRRDNVRITTRQDPTFRGARTVGDSGKLAKARYNHSSKGMTFGDWKRGREAQHLIPASLHKHFKPLTGIVDTARNGMMLPTESTFKTPSNSLIFKQHHKRAKPVHRRGKQRDHPTYTRNVRTFINDVVKLHGESMSQRTLRKSMDALRLAHQNIGRKQVKQNSKQYVDNISVHRMKTAWNAVHGTSDF